MPNAIIFFIFLNLLILAFLPNSALVHDINLLAHASWCPSTLLDLLIFSLICLIVSCDLAGKFSSKFVLTPNATYAVLALSTCSLCRFSLKILLFVWLLVVIEINICLVRDSGTKLSLKLSFQWFNFLVLLRQLLHSSVVLIITTPGGLAN